MKRSYLIPILGAVVLLVSALACGSDTEVPDATLPPPADTPVPTSSQRTLLLVPKK